MEGERLHCPLRGQLQPAGRMPAAGTSSRRLRSAAVAAVNVHAKRPLPLTLWERTRLKGFLRNQARGAAPPDTGAEDAQADCVARLAPLIAAFAGASTAVQWLTPRRPAGPSCSMHTYRACLASEKTSFPAAC